MPRPRPALALTIAAVLAVLTGLLAAAVPASAKPAAASMLDAQALAWAETQAGAPYVYGAAGPYSAGYDCSGLAMRSYAAVGVALPHSTYQMLADPHLHQVPVADAPPGSLLFFGPGHVELAVRPGVSFGAQRTGTVVGDHPYGGSWAPTAAYAVTG